MSLFGSYTFYCSHSVDYLAFKQRKRLNGIWEHCKFLDTYLWMVDEHLFQSSFPTIHALTAIIRMSFHRVAFNLNSVLAFYSLSVWFSE